jgi:hypothetical protein
MKILVGSAIIAALASTPALSQDVSLTGTWVGQRDRIAKVEGRRGGLATLVITEQQGNTFSGRLKRSNATGDQDEPLWGAFTPGARLMMGSDDEGFYLFSLIDPNTLDYCYAETAPSPRSGVRTVDPPALNSRPRAERPYRFAPRADIPRGASNCRRRISGAAKCCARHRPKLGAFVGAGHPPPTQRGLRQRGTVAA